MAGNRIQAYIDADPRGFERGLKQATRSLDGAAKRWQKSLAGFGRAFTGIVGAAGAGLGARALDQLAASSIRAGDEISKAAKTADIGAAALQEYRFAAELAGSSQKELDDAVGRFTRRLGEARRGNAEYTKAFKLLGVAATDTNEQALNNVFRTLADIKDVTIRTSLATKVFGDDARRMALIVRDGADGLDIMRKRARDLGLVLDDQAVAALENAQDQLTTLESQLRTKLLKTVADNLDGFLAFKTVLNDVAGASIGVAAVIGDAAEELQRFFDKIPGTTIRPQTSLDDLFERRDTAASRLKRFTEQARDIREEIAGAPRIREAVLTRELQAAEKRAKQAALDLVRVKQAIDARVNAPDLTRLPPPETEAPPDLSELKITSGPSLAPNKQKFIEGTKALADAFEEALTAEEQLEAKMVKLEALAPFATTLAETEKLAEILNGLQDEMDALRDANDEWLRAMEDAARGMADAFADAIVFGDRLGASLKRLAQQLASSFLSNFLQTQIGGVLKLKPRALGGPVAPGSAYLVGEKGPELFAPTAAGTIIPNGAGLGGGVNIQQTLRFDVGLESVEQRIAQVAPVIAAQTYEQIARLQRRPSHP